MTACCNRDLSTPFCPFCGKANADPLLEVAAYLRGKAATARKQADTRSKKPVVSASESLKVKAFVSKAEQYEAWADEVLALMKVRIIQGDNVEARS